MDHRGEVIIGRRFEFGANWELFLKSVDEDRIRMAEDSLRLMLRVDTLKGRRFLDIGSGSGLFSLAARRLGASVYSIDLDPQSIACTRHLREEYYAGDDQWIIEEGSVLDTNQLQRLGAFDVVYAWGVLHHTGNMWVALENAGSQVAEGGTLFISIYNDQGGKSRRWLLVKRAYNSLPDGLRWLIWMPSLIKIWAIELMGDLIQGRPFYSWKNYAKAGARGMSPFRDLIDWVGGLPFEVSKPEHIFEFCRERGFVLEKLKTCGGGLGCNEFVFVKKPQC